MEKVMGSDFRKKNQNIDEIGLSMFPPFFEASSAKDSKFGFPENENIEAYPKIDKDSLSISIYQEADKVTNPVLNIIGYVIQWLGKLLPIGDREKGAALEEWAQAFSWDKSKRLQKKIDH